MSAATCDTSVLVPFLLPWHEKHERARGALIGRVDAVPAHVFLECFSVLTRLAAPHRLSAASAGELLGALTWDVLELRPGKQRDLVTTLSRLGISGGAVYDGLVGATVVDSDRLLISADVRARRTYEALGVRVEYLA